jgi:hypothetical protein
MLGFAIPGLIVLFFVFLVSALADRNAPMEMVIGVVSGLGVFAICFSGIFVQMVERFNVRDAVDAFVDYGRHGISKPIAYRSNFSALKGFQWMKLLLKLQGAGSSSNFLVEEIELRLKGAGIYLNVYGWQPITFVTFRDKGEVLWKWRGIQRRCRGIAKGHWCEVEWHGDVEQALSLVRHELAHVILMETYPNWCEAEQHDVMCKAGID